MPGERYQVGDACYDDVAAAGAALLAQWLPTIVQMPTDGGPAPFMVTAGEFVPGDGAGQLTYEYVLLADGSSGGQLVVDHYPISCALDLAVLPAQVTPANVATAFSWGLGAIFMFWALGYVIGLATGLIRKA